MKQKDIQIAHLQSQIKSHGEEMQRLEASRAEALQQVSARPQPVLTGDPQQRTLLSQIQQAEDRLAVLRPARARMMNDLKTAREELNELYGELLPEEGELGPGQ